jgi:hypothetical protein
VKFRQDTDLYLVIWVWSLEVTAMVIMAFTCLQKRFHLFQSAFEHDAVAPLALPP